MGARLVEGGRLVLDGMAAHKRCVCVAVVVSQVSTSQNSHFLLTRLLPKRIGPTT